MSGYNSAAWLQFHRGMRLHTLPIAPQGDRHLCPDCGNFMTREWFVSIFGVAPEVYGRTAKAVFVDPSDDRTWLEDRRAVR